VRGAPDPNGRTHVLTRTLAGRTAHVPRFLNFTVAPAGDAPLTADVMREMYKDDWRCGRAARRALHRARVTRSAGW
jgi:hypothetical protein